MKKFFILLVLVYANAFGQQPLQIIPDYVHNVHTVTNDLHNNPHNISFEPGQAIITQGYNSPGDNGGAYYVVEEDSLSTHNGGDIIRITSNRIARLTPHLPVTVKQFGAVGDGVTLDSDNIQKCLDYCMTNQINDLRIPKGIYLLNKGLKINNPSSSQGSRPSGIHIKGDGVSNTQLKFSTLVTNEPMLFINGVTASGNYINGGSIEDINFNGNRAGNSENHGIALFGWWYAKIVNCKIEKFKGDGIHQITDLTVNENPDWSASISVDVKHVGIERCEGYGYNNTGLQGGPNFIFEESIFSLNKKGGAYIQSSSNAFKNCSFSANGWSDEYDSSTASPNPAYGIHFGGTSKTVNSRHIVEGCEFDNNKDAHIACSYMSNSRVANNRFIHEDRPEFVNTPSIKSIVFAPGSANEALQNIEFTSNFFRIFNSSFKGFNWENTANVSNIFVERNTMSDQTSGTANIEPYLGYDVGNRHIIYNYVIEDRNVFADNKNIISGGTPPPFYLGSLNPNNIPPGTTGPINLKFDLPDASFSAPYHDSSDHYNISTGEFICPENGYYDINVYLTLRDLTTSEQARLHIKKNGTIVYSEYVWGTGHTRINMDLSTRFFATKSDVITVELDANGGIDIETSETFGFNRLFISLVD